MADDDQTFTDAPALGGEGQSLASILGLEEAAPSGQTIHERMADQFAAIMPPAEPGARLIARFDDPQSVVASWVRNSAERELGFGATWVRLIRTDLGRGALFAVHNPHRDGEAEMIMLAEPGVLTRAAVREACRWAFYGLGLWRVVVRIPVDRSDLADFARRAGFRFEGTARRFFGGALDAQVWAMCGPECRWLTREPSPIPTADTSPPASLKVH